MPPAADDTPASPAWSAVRPWRVRTRERLIAERLALAPAVRSAQAERARGKLAGVDLTAFAVLDIY